MPPPYGPFSAGDPMRFFTMAQVCHAAFRLGRYTVAGALLISCLPYNAVDTAASPVAAPEQYSAGGEAHAGARAPSDAGWWEDFGDPQLNALEERLLAQNLQLRAAWARLQQAEAVSGLAGAQRWPQASLSARAGRQRQRFGAFEPQEFDSFSLSVPVSYELDLFDRLGAEDAASELDALASRRDTEALALTLSAQLAEAWFLYLEAHDRERVLQQQLTANQTFLDLVTLRFREGLAAAVEVHQQTAQVAGTRSQLMLAAAQRRLTRHRLALLLGEPPQSPVIPVPDQDESTASGMLSHQLPAPPTIGVPADLLLERPDVRAARLRVASADRRVGAAIANWFPSLRLDASAGFNAISLGDLFSELVWSLVGSLTQTLFDGGQRHAEIDRNKAIVSERLDVFAETFLTAIHEVENALVQEQQQDLYLSELVDQVASLRASLEQARQRYQEGLTDFLPVLTAQTSLQNVELSLLSGRRERIGYRIQLYRALGGSWTQQLDPLPLRGAEEADESESKGADRD